MLPAMGTTQPQSVERTLRAFSLLEGMPEAEAKAQSKKLKVKSKSDLKPFAVFATLRLCVKFILIVITLFARFYR